VGGLQAAFPKLLICGLSTSVSWASRSHVAPVSRLRRCSTLGGAGLSLRLMAGSAALGHLSAKGLYLLSKTGRSHRRPRGGTNVPRSKPGCRPTITEQTSMNKGAAMITHGLMQGVVPTFRRVSKTSAASLG
jgi:hypothetical protein